MTIAGTISGWWHRHVCPPTVPDGHPWTEPSTLDRADGAGTRRPWRVGDLIEEGAKR